MILISKLHHILKYTLRIVFTLILLFTIVTCAANESQIGNLLGGNGNGNGEKVNITQADVDRLQFNWQQAFNNINDGIILPDNPYVVYLMLNELYSDNITSTEILTIHFTPSDNGILMIPEDYSVIFDQALRYVTTQAIIIEKNVKEGKNYTIDVSLSSEALDQTFIFSLNLSMSTSLHQEDVDTLQKNWQQTFNNINDGAINRNSSYTVSLILNELYSGTATENLTIDFTPSDSGITLSQPTYT